VAAVPHDAAFPDHPQSRNCASNIKSADYNFCSTPFYLKSAS
jgi:hypothetical protein